MPAQNYHDQLAKTLSACRQRIIFLAEQTGRQTDDISLLVVSKSQPAHSIRILHHAGQNDFGENYLQEALSKIKELHDLFLNWHFIGHIQRNKTQLIAQHFSWVHSIDSTLIATRLNDARKSNKSMNPLNVCVQINIDNDPQKNGIALKDAEPLLRHIMTLSHLCLRGLMILPKAHIDPEQTLASFQKAKGAFDQFNQLGMKLDTLSMGMSDDMEQAIAAGSTMVRIGKNIFKK